MMMRRSPRGSALLAALIVIGVLALVTVATLRLASISKDQASKDSRSLSQTACVEAARQYLMGRLRVFGLDATTITFNTAVPLENGNRVIRTGHIDTAAITSVRAVGSGSVGGAVSGLQDMTNKIVAGPTMGGRPYQAVVTCEDPHAGPMELEFIIRWGL
jgi:type II secretory pathway pseudopilin PulG